MTSFTSIPIKHLDILFRAHPYEANNGTGRCRTNRWPDRDAWELAVLSTWPWHLAIVQRIATRIVHKFRASIAFHRQFIIPFLSVEGRAMGAESWCGTGTCMCLYVCSVTVCGIWTEDCSSKIGIQNQRTHRARCHVLDDGFALLPQVHDTVLGGQWRSTGAELRVIADEAVGSKLPAELSFPSLVPTSFVRDECERRGSTLSIYVYLLDMDLERLLVTHCTSISGRIAVAHTQIWGGGTPHQVGVINQIASRKPLGEHSMNVSAVCETRRSAGRSGT